MSQATLLEEVEQWTPEVCKAELKTVLPKLVSIQCCTESWTEHTRVLRIIMGMFLPHLHLSKMEEECLSVALPRVVSVFGHLMGEISSQVSGLSSQNPELTASLRSILQVMAQTLEAVTLCVRQVCALEGVSGLSDVRSIPTCVLYLLRHTFQHCKESEVVYSGRLSMVGDLLQALFKEAYALQKGLIDLLDQINLQEAASEEEVSDIVSVLHSLLDICSIISSLDMALHANTWKFIIKQSVKYQSLVEEHLRHADITSCLCEDLLGSLKSCLELAEQIHENSIQAQSPEVKLFQKSTKMCRFFANTLVHYVKEFKDFLPKCCPRIHLLFLQVYSKFPPSLSAPSLNPALWEELSGAVLVAMDALLNQLLSLRSFAESLLALEQHSSEDTALAQCLLLVNVLAQLSSHPEEALELWCDGSQFPEETPRLSVFEAVFRSFGQCVLERLWPVRLPGVMVGGQAQGNVTLHQHVCVHLCACVAALPAPQLPPLERSLFWALLQPDIHTALLAVDVWCFLARYGTAELCLHHVLLVVDLVKSCSSDTPQWIHLSLLLRRMLFLMTPTHQMELLHQCPASQEENVRVWGHVLLHSLASDVRARLERDLTSTATSVAADWHRDGCRLGGVARLNMALWALKVVVKVEVPETECVSSILPILTELWPRMCASQVQKHRLLQQTLCLLLSLSACIVKNLEPQTISQAVCCLSSLLPMSLGELDEVSLAALDFLAALGSIFIPADKQPTVLPQISAVFSTLLASSSWLLHQHALEAFGIFAEVTNHEEVISQCLTSEETRTRVVNFLSKTVAGEEQREARLERLKAESVVLDTHLQFLRRGKLPLPKTSTHVDTETHTPAEQDKEQQSTTCQTQDEDKMSRDASIEPCAKRARADHGDCWGKEEEERARGHLQTAEEALQSLQGILGGAGGGSRMTPPHWLPIRLRELQRLLAEISTQAEDFT